ncbi:MAG: histidinol dehydrogenase, partial [Gammaproteobacteria bacterium]|nr:histidinol dehydrogenase [Gammaproteobacteria bacterium]
MSDQKIARLDAALPDFPEAFDRLLITPSEADSELAGVVAGIIAEVATEGDLAVVRLTNRFDDRDVAGMESLQLRDEDIEHAWASIDDGVRQALIHAADRIRDFHERQLAHSWDYEDAEGNLLGQRVSALDRVGIYVPGGRASYPSSVLMN